MTITAPSVLCDLPSAPTAGPTYPGARLSDSTGAEGTTGRTQTLTVTVLSSWTIVRDALGQLIGSHPRFAADSEDPSSLCAGRPWPRGDLLLLEMDVPLTKHLHTLRLLVQRLPQSRTVLLVGECDSPQAVACFAAGASAIVKKSEPTESLFEALELVHSQSPLLRGSMAQSVLATIPTLFDRHGCDGRGTGAELSIPSAITRREKEVACHVADHLTTSEIARTMGISSKTVRNHISNIYMKLGIATRKELQARVRAASGNVDMLR